MITYATVSTRRFSRRTFLTLSGAALALGTGHQAFQTTQAQESEPSAFLSANMVHDIAVEIDADAFQDMIEAYQQTGEKNWISGTVTINGSIYEQVGLRLKGNSSLRTLLGQFGPTRNSDGATAKPENTEPVSLPWLIKLDENVKGQNHEGMEQLVVRSNTSTTSLNEAVALNLLDRAGLASQQAAAIRFSVNGGDQILRLAIENPKGKWMRAHFPEDGILYKSEAEGDWSYRGDDYQDYLKIAFDLEAGDTGDDAADFVPLIDFLDFLNNSDDATFVEELPDRLDIDQFAVYLAMMDMIANTDDIDGPGNNSYLYWNRTDEDFTVVPWDMNLAFGGFGMMGQNPGGDRQFPAPSQPGTDGNQDSGDESGQWPVPGIQGERGDIPPLTNESGTPVTGGEFPFPMTTNESGTPVATGDGNQASGRSGLPGQNGGFGGRANPLVQRFSANSEWADLIQTTTENLRASLYESGEAAEILNQWVSLLSQQATDLVSNDTLQTEAGTISAYFEG